jgi:hypothetical protein
MQPLQRHGFRHRAAKEATQVSPKRKRSAAEGELQLSAKEYPLPPNLETRQLGTGGSTLENFDLSKSNIMGLEKAVASEVKYLGLSRYMRRAHREQNGSSEENQQ